MTLWTGTRFQFLPSPGASRSLPHRRKDKRGESDLGYQPSLGIPTDCNFPERRLCPMAGSPIRKKAGTVVSQFGPALSVRKWNSNPRWGATVLLGPPGILLSNFRLTSPLDEEVDRNLEHGCKFLCLFLANGTFPAQDL